MGTTLLSFTLLQTRPSPYDKGRTGGVTDYEKQEIPHVT